MGILIGSDIVPTGSNRNLFVDGNIEELCGIELKNIILTAQYRIFNLEVPLTDVNGPIPKHGGNLIASTTTINAYKNLKIDLLTLANNHVMDQGHQGLNSTINVLENAGIKFVGAGCNLKEAQKSFAFKYNDKIIGVYACAEHEFSIAKANIPGANPFDPLDSPDHILKLKEQCDYVIVLYHGGKEYYRYPSPNLQKICRKLVDKGADLVVCQHSHCIGCEEKYKAGTIVYGQGNFLFDAGDDEFWNTSLLIKIEENFSVSYIPLAKEGKSVHLATNMQTKKIMKEFYYRSNQIKQEGFIDTQYRIFSQKKLVSYLLAITGINRNIIFRAINKLSGHRFEKWFVKLMFNKEKRLMLTNCIECEAHRELFLNGLKNK